MERITITIEAGAGTLAAAGNYNSRKPCPKSKRKPISGGSSGVGGRVGGTSRPAVATAEPSTRAVEHNKRTRVDVGKADAEKNDSAKRRKAVAVVQRSRSPIRRPMPALPYPPKHAINTAWKKVPPIPKLTVSTSRTTIRLTWDDGISLGSYHLYAAMAGHELYVCVLVDGGARSGKWEKLTFVEALPPSHNRRQPVGCKMTDMARGVEYYFAVRPVDVHDRRGPFAVVYARL